MADQPDRNAALDTYRFLRGGMVVMVCMLGGALVVERLHATCWQTSISAYYFTTAHTVFIGALYGLGAMLIVYQGFSDTENTLLNLAGVLGFVIATVPTTRPVLLCSPVDPVVSTAGPATLFNIWTVAVVLALSRLASWWLFGRADRTNGTLGYGALWLQRVVLGVGVLVLVLAPEWFRLNGHGIAAAAMFAAIVLTVFNTAYGSGETMCGAGYRRVYQAISISMAITLSAAVAVHLLLDNFNHTVLVVELALIVQFAAYWVVQTVQDDDCSS